MNKNNKHESGCKSRYKFPNTVIEYDANAKVPELWLTFLKSALDEESITILQEWFGYCLLRGESLKKALVITGGPCTGKSTAVSILKSLIGEMHCCYQTPNELQFIFGLSNIIGKSLMILEGSSSLSGNRFLNRVKAITCGEEVIVSSQLREPITQVLGTKIIFILDDDSKLLIDGLSDRRLVRINFPGFDGKPDPHLIEKLNCEMQGILNWAIEGMNRLYTNNSFTLPSCPWKIDGSDDPGDPDHLMDAMSEIEDEGTRGLLEEAGNTLSMAIEYKSCEPETAIIMYGKALGLFSAVTQVSGGRIGTEDKERADAMYDDFVRGNMDEEK